MESYKGWTIQEPEDGSYWFKATREGERTVVSMTVEGLREEIDLLERIPRGKS